jgi:hypothetical protein
MTKATTTTRSTATADNTKMRTDVIARGSHSLSAGLHSNLVVPQLSSAVEGWAVPARSG